MLRIVVTISILTLLLHSVLAADAEDRYPTFTNSKNAGPDFSVQGDYVGFVGGSLPVGAQVIALGDGEFEGVMFSGGLPGAGWNRSNRRYFRGKTEGQVTELVGVCGYELAQKETYWRGTIQQGVLRGSDESFHQDSKQISFLLHRVERNSPTMGARPPAGATVLFDGSTVDDWSNAKIVEGALLLCGAKSDTSFADHKLHLEFRTPFMPSARGMHRGNSGVLIRDKYEIQIVDSFGWTHINRRFVRNSWVGRCGGIEELFPPDINMSFPPLSWQTYDVDFSMPRYDETGKQTIPPMISVLHNGVLIHNRRVLPPESQVRPDRDPGRLYLQDHHDRVVFRNIWVVEANRLPQSRD